MGIAASARVWRLVAPAFSAELVRQSGGQPPGVLHHYSTLQGLLGIVDSGGLFLSDARFVNDASEGSYGRDVFLSRLKACAGKKAILGAPEVFENTLRAYERRDDGAWNQYQLDHSYVASFCTDGDLLSQWRAYAASAGAGCSIGFRTEDLVGRAAISTNAKDTGPSNTGQLSLQRVIYQQGEQEVFVDALLSRILEAAAADHHPSRWRYLADIIVASLVPAVVSRLKHPAFADEKEWRLVWRARPGLRFRVDRRGLVPYLLCRFSDDSHSHWGLPPIAEIRIGPSDSARLTKTAVVELLRARGFPEETAVLQSTIPLRP